MAGDDDKERTVFGQKLPPSRPRSPAPQTPPAGGGVDRTVFGAPIPQSPAGGRVAPAQPRNAPGPDDTWLGGALNPTPSYAPQQPQYQQPQYQPAQYRPQSLPTGADMFPEVPQRQEEAPRGVVPRISLDDALRGTGLGKGGSTNPMVAAAANLLILLGRLRTGLVEMQSGPLIDHVTREIDLYERNLLAAGVSPQDATDGKYALASTADDIVQNLPGADRGTWLQYSMVARFFGERSSGVGFFRKIDEAMKAPGQRFQLLELMLTCLSLGFEGQYRTSPNGAVDLAKVRAAIYETLRRVQPRPDDDISVNWIGVPLGIRRRFGGTPVWAVAAVAALMVVAMFATLSTLLARQGSVVQQEILALHRGLPAISIERTEPVTQPYVAPVSQQLDRIRAALTGEIDQGLVVVDQTNQFIFVRVGDALRFASGSADLENDFSELAAAIARSVDPEAGPIRVVGYTDSIPPSGRGRFKTNEDLSLARADTVGGIMGPLLADPTRVATEGLGPVDPIADNETTEGRALNRRVEIMIAREGTF